VVAKRAAWKNALTTYVVRPLEVVALHVLYFFFRILPISAASAIAGKAARLIGPRLGLSRRARKNIRRVFPKLNDVAVEEMVQEMWENLGRLAGELPHLPKIKVFDDDAASGPRRVDVVGIEHLDTARDSGKPIIFFTAHIGNWEIGPLVSSRRDMPLHVIYRSSNNRFADQLFLSGRRNVVGGMIPKGADGARQAMKVLQENKPLGMLVDQKMNDGIPVPFFGSEAMTAPALAQLAFRYDCIVLPAWVERLEGVRFRVTVEPPLAFTKSGERMVDARNAMTKVNARIEDWIRARPGQWLWLHRRWPD
jgi:Kdo2-lipid IVA lauroyltransferase/acyltransferase